MTLLAAGPGQAFDPINRLGDWGYNAAFVDTDTIASTNLNSRFDLLWETAPVRNTNGGNGLKDMPSTYHVFGNNGSVALRGAVTAASNTALADLPNRLTVLTDLTHCSDHLPVLQTYVLTTSTGPATHFVITPSANPVVAGTPFAITVAAQDASGQTVLGYTGTVHFTASNGAMAQYTFQPSDMGVHTFSGLVLRQAGTLTVTGTDTTDLSLAGSATFTINPAAPDHIALVLPPMLTAGVPFSLTVTVLDAFGNTVSGYTGTVHLVLTGPAAQTANYTFTAADMGSHTFSGLVLSQAGAYTLTATDQADPGLTGGTNFTVM
jgi:hypothetical protein